MATAKKKITETKTKKTVNSVAPKNETFFSAEERPGTLIIVEGSDGSGKSTQLLIAKN